MAEPSVFTKIIDREIPAEIVLENDRLIAFQDIAPQAEMHIVVAPKTADYENVTQLATHDPELLAEIVLSAQAIANERNDGQYRLVFNTGELVGQTVMHVHAHVLGGTRLEEGHLA